MRSRRRTTRAIGKPGRDEGLADLIERESMGDELWDPLRVVLLYGVFLPGAIVVKLLLHSLGRRGDPRWWEAWLMGIVTMGLLLFAVLVIAALAQK